MGASRGDALLLGRLIYCTEKHPSLLHGKLVYWVVGYSRWPGANGCWAGDSFPAPYSDCSAPSQHGAGTRGCLEIHQAGWGGGQSRAGVVLHWIAPNWRTCRCSPRESLMRNKILLQKILCSKICSILLQSKLIVHYSALYVLSVVLSIWE